MKKLKTIALFGCLLFSIKTTAQNADGLLIHYNFENLTGTAVEDVSGNGVTAHLINNAKVEEMGTYHVLNLGSSNGYLNMTTAAGKALASTDTYSISTYYFVEEDASLEGAGFFLWSFSTSTAVGAADGKYAAYRLNAQRVATSTGGYQNEVGIETGSASPKGVWKHVAYIQNGLNASLYIDGVLIGSVTNMPRNSTNFGSTSPSYNWLGRPAFTTDSYLKDTKIADFRLYSKALTVSEVTQLAGKTKDLTYQYEHGSLGDKTALMSAIADAEAFLSSSSIENYMIGAVEDFRDQLFLAQQCAASDMVSQAYIDNRLKALDAARKTLEAYKGLEFDISNLTDSYDTERGFRHPGGLHTNADFERIKAQLASGNTKVTQAWNVLLASEYSQSDVSTWPTETIWRSGSGDNYLNAARGAHMAYQNALRWKIAGTKANADGAVRILMAWVDGSKYVSGNTNLSLASGLYGYEFAQAAELMRDYSGWKKDDFERFKEWIKRVWYPACIDFLRRRHDTWLNAANVASAGGGRPGHYWSNWGLCNALAVMSFGILCDDVHMYNQGLSYYKYDQVGNWAEATGSQVNNIGLTEYLGNLVPALGTDARGPYGKLGQMQESGRDQGHATMALGLAVDICQTAWSQGDDLYSYMDNRLAAGIEGLAAYNFGNVNDGPWTNYGYADCRTAWHNAWVQTGHNEGSRGQIRAYWARIVGHYEGVKGVKMRYSDMALNNMGIDDGGTGGSSGDYDHLGYSVLTCTYDGMASDDTKPTLLTPKMTVNGKVVYHNELGGLENTYEINTNTGVVPGTVITLSPQLPSGATDTGKWQWNTGETTKDITISADKSYLYRATYTNENGIESEQVFSIYVQGDCSPFGMTAWAQVNDHDVEDIHNIEVFYGNNVVLGINGGVAYGRILWDNGRTEGTRTVKAIRDREISGMYITQGGRQQPATFKIHVISLKPRIILNGVEYEDSTHMIVRKGDNVVISPMIAANFTDVKYKWSNGSEDPSLTFNDIDESQELTLTFTSNEGEFEQTYKIMVIDEENGYDLEEGKYLLVYNPTGYALTYSEGQLLFMEPQKDAEDTYISNQIWTVIKTNDTMPYKYNFYLESEDKYLSSTGRATASGGTFYLYNALGTDLCIGKNTSGRFWSLVDDKLNTLNQKELLDFPFMFVPITSDITGISLTRDDFKGSNDWFTMTGIRLYGIPQTKGIYIHEGKKVVIR